MDKNVSKIPSMAVRHDERAPIWAAVKASFKPGTGSRRTSVLKLWMPSLGFST